MISAGSGDITLTPPAGFVSPSFVLRAPHGAGTYDVQVNAVDAQGRYGPDARGTVTLDASGRAGTLSTPDLSLPSGDSVRFDGAWRCSDVQNITPPSERPGGPQSPR